MLADFAQCVEFTGDTVPCVAAGLWELSQPAAEIALLSDALFAQVPDFADFEQDSAQLADGSATLPAIANAVLASANFQNDYGTLSDTAFVTLLYANALHTAPDPAGLASWVADLAGGASRGDVAVDFAMNAGHMTDDAANVFGLTEAQQGVVVSGAVTASAAVIGAGLDVLQAEAIAGAITAITPTDAGVPRIAVSLAQITDDTAALRFIAGGFDLDLGTATVASAGAGVRAENLGTTTSADAVQFADGRLVFSTADPAAEIFRLYGAALDRLPDGPGEAVWTENLAAGLPLAAIAQDFLTCGEFAADYGTTMSDATFVILLSEHTLGAAPAPADLTADVAALANGMSRASMLLSFSDSAAYIASTAPAIRGGIWDLS